MAVVPEAQEMWLSIWETVWQVMSYLNPTPASGLAGFIFTPLNLILSWLIFGLVAHLTARIFGGDGRLGQTLGATSLAAAPQLLALFNVLPFVTLAGISIWSLLARYLAIRVTHDLSWGRALWVTVLATLIVALLLVFLVGAGAAAFAATMSATFAGGF
jgi:hypothetical protein